MIRVRVDDTVFTVKSIEGRYNEKRVILKDYVDRSYTFTANLASSQMVEDLINQACKQGFVDFTEVTLVGKIECKID